jgi:potassium channel subfamily K, other eukaryote|mmetsp:Transcript_1613/g.5835  ORF Transcript_1613/g.5835 Transcript_1613/m.5835 type:complete len:379 (-) Transcript_1613:216-1352(-)
MPRDPTKPRDAPGKYGAIARDEEHGVRDAWRARDENGEDMMEGFATKLVGSSERRHRKRRPAPPAGEPRPGLIKRFKNFCFNNMALVFLAYVCAAAVALEHMNDEPDFGTFIDTVYFIAITVTTVGYGDMSPKSDAGKIFVMVFIIVGVALAGVMMTKITDWMLEKQKNAVKRSEEKAKEMMQQDLAKLKQNLGARVSEAELARSTSSKEAEGKSKVEANPIASALVVISIVVTLGAVVMGQLEGISFLDGCYWSIVTSTTVGYGDVTPKSADGRIFASFYAFITVGVMGWAVGQIASSAISTSVEAASHVEAFKLTPESLVQMGGEKGYVDQYDFAVAMMLAMGKATQEDFDLVANRFNELDVNHDKTLDAKDLLGQ